MGPDQGTVIEPCMLLASTNRVALDAVGVAVLRYFGTTPEVEKGPIFEQEQIKRAAELGTEVQSAEDIDIIPLDDTSETVSENIEIM
ncbi:MAG: hypothetical protein HXS46_16570 [Theionarchaea archaeon]|nr:MAG: hypothetical protein AYK18_13700 [Theionarchaea archaeon DG-70]MBU7012298.1 hypothetical protein [Theionarchaea archaeon]